MIFGFFFFFLLWSPMNTGATVYYADNQLPSGNCTTGNYNYAARDCTGSDGNAYTTPAAVISPITAGDTICVRSGTTWTAQWDFQTPNKTGTVGNYITMGGCNGETPTIQVASSANPGYGPIKARGARGYFIFENMILDGSASTDASKSGWSIRDGNHHFILRNLEIKNFKNVSAVYIEASDVLIQNCTMHDQYSPSGGVGTRHYAVYYHHGDRVTVEGNNFYNNDGGGMQIAPGPANNSTIRYNRIHDNNRSPGVTIGGLKLRTSLSEGGGPITNIRIYGNEFYNNGSNANAGTAYGLQLESTDVSTISVHNNVIYGNKSGGMTVNGPTTGIDVRNNLISGNTGTELTVTGGGSATITHSACTSAESCGSTNKVTLTTGIGDCVVDATTQDFRLKQGTNPCRGAGTSVTTRPAPIGVTDIGPFEQGLLESAVVVSRYIEITTNVITEPLTPTSGLTGLTVTCVGCTGTPVVSQAMLKGDASAVIQATISGISSPGTCTISLGSTNIADSQFIGPSTNSYSQKINSVTGLAVSGTCDNTVAGGGAPTPTHSRFQLDEGTGTTATDDTGNGNHGTVSSGVTWVTGSSGTGVTIPTDATYRHVATTYGSGVNPTTQSFAQCVRVVPDLTAVPSVILSAGSNGTNQRAYVGISTVSGQPQWGIGVQSSGFTTGSEFVAQAQPTLVCITFDSGTDTATLWVNGVKGTQSGRSVKTYTSYTLAGNLRVGNDGTFTVNNGGFTVYLVWTWNTLPSDSDLQDLYESEFPSGTPLACHTQVTHKAELIYTNGSSPISYGSAGGIYDVVDGGGIALVFQIDCTAVAGSPLALRFFYSTDGTNYNLEIPSILGSDGIAMWGQEAVGLNSGTATCCISGALTASNGITLVTSNLSPVINLAQNQSYTIRILLRFSTGLSGQSRWILAKQDNGLELANGYTLGGARINIISPRASTPF